MTSSLCVHAVHFVKRSYLWLPFPRSSSVETSTSDVRVSLLCACPCPRSVTYCTLPVVVLGPEGVWLFLARKESCDAVTVKPVSSEHGLRRLHV
jgi:hypothetical protein